MRRRVEKIVQRLHLSFRVAGGQHKSTILPLFASMQSPPFICSPPSVASLFIIFQPHGSRTLLWSGHIGLSKLDGFLSDGIVTQLIIIELDPLDTKILSHPKSSLFIQGRSPRAETGTIKNRIIHVKKHERLLEEMS